MNRIAIFFIPFVLTLTACDDTGAPDAANGELGGKAEGKILGGSISDDMIPLEEIRSQSPPARKAAGGDADGGAEAGGSAEPDGGAQPDGGAEPDDGE